MLTSKAPSKKKGRRRSKRSSSQSAMFAAVDLGTNNCRLLIAEPQGKRFRVVDSYSQIVRLGEGLSASGELSEAAINRTLGAGSGLVAIVLGMIITVAVQSSSITTSVLVPLAAAGVLSLENVYPVTLGANVGTTVTALLASLATGSPAAVTVALVHTLFNLTGIALFYPVRSLRALPIRLATGLARIGAERRTWAVTYVLAMFLVIPLLGVMILR